MLLIAVVSLVPGLLWLAYFYHKDRFEPEPKALVLKTFLVGLFSVLAAALFERPFHGILVGQPSLPTLFLGILFGVGVVEEGVKLLVVYYTVYRTAQFNEPMDGIVYGTSAGLGFAVLENLLYTTRFGLAVAPARALLTSLAHASFTGLAGFYLARAKLGEPRLAVMRIFFGLALAVFLHTAYDFIILSRLMPAGALVVAAVSYALLTGRIREALRLSPFKPGSTKE